MEMNLNNFNLQHRIEDLSILEHEHDFNEFEIDLFRVKGKILKATSHIKSVIKTMKDKIRSNYVEIKEIDKKRGERSKVEKLKVKPMQLFFAPYFRDSRKCHPPPHPVTIEKQTRGDLDAYFCLPPPWGITEQNKFVKIVSELVVDSVLSPMNIRLDFLVQKLNKAVSDLEPEECQMAIQKQMEEIMGKMACIRKKPLTEILKHPDCKVDWLLVSGQMMRAGFDRCPDSCESMWKNALCPLINKKRFTTEEDKKLKSLAQKYDQRNWNAISQELGTGRTAVQCFERFQSHLTDDIIKRNWIPEEDEALEKAIKENSIGDYIPWNRVHYFMEGRTVLQCQNRWDRNLKPQKKDGWTIEEDTVLMLAIAVLKAPLWCRISNMLYGRTSYYCRERYINCLDPELVTGAWTADEDRQLLILLSKHGEKWGQISRHMPKRTDNMVNNRLKIIKRYNRKIYEAILKRRSAYNFKTLPKKLMAPSKICADINADRDRLRLQAFKCAKTAIESVFHGNIDLSGCKNFQDLGNRISEATLERVVEEILPKDYPELIRPEIKYYTRNMTFKVEENESEEDEENKNVVNSSTVIKKEFRSYEGLNIEDIKQEIDNRLLSCAFIGQRNYIPAINLQTHKRGLEYSALIHYLCRAFSSIREPLKISPEFEEEEFTFYKINYNEVIPKIMDSCIPVNHSGVIASPLVPFNNSIFKALFSIILSKKCLQSWVEKKSPEDIEMLKLISGYELCPVCRPTNTGCNIFEEDENGGKDENRSCTCDLIEYYRKRREVFLCRFFAIFTFASLCYHVSPSEEQIQNLIINLARKTTENIQKNFQKKKRSCAESDDSYELEDEEYF